MLGTIAQKYGTPVYVYDAQIIDQRVDALKNAFADIDNIELLYAIKANPNPHIVKRITSHGIGIDAVSLEEVQLALYCGIAAEKILYTGNNMSDTEMDAVHELGVLLNIGSLSRLKTYGERHPGANVCIRVNPNVGSASHESNITGGPDSKFGISYADVDRAQAVAETYNLNIIGLHQHIGSGWLHIAEPLLALDVILDIAKDIPHLSFIDLGGGFGVPYHPGDEPLDLSELGKRIAQRLSTFFIQYGSAPKLRIEPGRFLVAESGTLLTQVTAIKQSIRGHRIVGTDTGMHHLIRPAFYGSYHHIRNASNPDGEKQLYDVVGNVCECADFFAKDRELPEVREGDILAIETAGAYGMSMASHYQCRALPAEILLNDREITVIRERETFDDILGQWPKLSS